MSIRYCLAGSADSASVCGTLRMSGASKARSSIRIVQGLPAFNDYNSCVENRPYLEPALAINSCFLGFLVGEEGAGTWGGKTGSPATAVCQGSFFVVDLSRKDAILSLLSSFKMDRRN